jgi:phage shock protein PspC (stress-responsive transcriptional regulator)
MDLFGILFWVFAIGFGAVVIILVYVLLAFVWPSRNSAARFFIKGRRENKEVVALDDGSRWIFKVAEKRAPGLLIDDDGLPITVTSKSLKWGGGVYFGVGEYFRSTIANITVVEFLARAKAEGYTQNKLNQLIKMVNDGMKKLEGENVEEEEGTRKTETDDS